MTNSFSFRCPACGSTDQIDIAAEVWVRVTPGGTDADASGDGSHFWDQGSPALCGACGCHGSVADFEKSASNIGMSPG